MAWPTSSATSNAQSDVLSLMPQAIGRGQA
jgi:hypothetical protein